MITDDKGVTIVVGQRVTLPDGAVGFVVEAGDTSADVELANGKHRVVGENECRVVDEQEPA